MGHLKTLLSWRSTRTRILAVLVGLTLALGLSALFHASLNLNRILEGQLELRGLAIGRNLAARSTMPFLSGDLFALYELVNEGLLNNPDVRYVFLVEPSGEARVSTFEGSVPPGLVGANPLGSQPEEAHRWLRTSEGPILDIAVAVPEIQGWEVHVGMSRSVVQRQVSGYIAYLAELVGLAIVAAALLSLVLATVLIRPLTRLAEAARAVGRGDLSRRVPVDMADEVGEVASAFNTMTDELVTSRNQLLQLYQEVQRKEEARGHLLTKVMRAQEEERRRIAREIHDAPAQALTGVILQLDRVERHLVGGREVERHEVERARQAVRGAMEALHRIMVELRPQALDDLGFLPAIRWYAEERLRERGVEVEMEVRGVPHRLDPQVETAAFRVLQEAVTNISKHASARHTAICLDFGDGALRASVEDDGAGFDLATIQDTSGKDRGLGLLGMQERINLLEGTFTILSAPGKGTRVSFEIPLTAREK